MAFIEKLRSAQQKQNSWVCVGLDPDRARIPKPFTIEAFCICIIRATASIASAYKPNLAFFLAHGSGGIRALEKVLAEVPSDIPIILDAKFGDIGNTQRLYGQMAFEHFGVDALTVSPYVGADAIQPMLAAYPGKGLFVLGRTSNAGSDAVQTATEPMLYQHITALVAEWQQPVDRSLGLVVGATQPETLKEMRQQVPSVPFLIPGIGVQGGSLEAAVRYGMTLDGLGPVINSSRGILYASGSQTDFQQAAYQAAEQLQQQINAQREVVS